MGYRLLVDLDAIAVLDALPKKVRNRMLDHLEQIRATPDRYSDCQEYDNTGRRIEINVFTSYSIHFWIDFADRHVKVLAIKTADR